MVRAASSNSVFAMVIISLLFLVVGALIGVRVGEEISAKLVTKRDYVLANLAAFGLGVIACAIVWMTGWVLFAALVIGVIAGVIAGLKLGFGESVGPWKFHDRYLRVNKDQLKRSEEGKRAEDVRRARKSGKEPELMSVAPHTGDKSKQRGDN